MKAARAIVPKLVTVRESTWRAAAAHHTSRIKSLLQPGLTSPDHPLNSGRNRGNRQQRKDWEDWTALDPINPVFNFLIEYYGLKGAKGARRLGRWAPDPRLLLDDITGDNAGETIDHTVQSTTASDEVYNAAMEASYGLGGILLENANLDDLGSTLYLRGSVPVPASGGDVGAHDNPELHGILYNPAVFYGRHLSIGEDDAERRLQLRKTIAPFQWYQSILQTTLASEPILHCYGLHEWAMQYHPAGAPPPPSAKYQSNLSLRVSRETINETVERKGIRCTHVDALRFFAPAAGPLNHHGAELKRTDQLRLEQRGCVHAHMDLLKIGLKLHGFVDSELVCDVLEVALASRKLDVAASPYDATQFGAGIVPVETNEGRKQYREEQVALMHQAAPVRERLLGAYDAFLQLAFDESLLGRAINRQAIGGGSNEEGESPYVAPERLARAQPGGLPWRKNLITET
ncbi:hypothetical protein ACHAXT_002030 [Thalassiosira profunda]